MSQDAHADARNRDNKNQHQNRVIIIMAKK